jgi:hypothetical protein
VNDSEIIRHRGVALEKMHQFLVWMVPTVERFPRNQKFLLGDRIQSVALDVLERLIEATYSKQPKTALQSANLGVEKLRHLFRLATELKHLDMRRYEHSARSLDEVGRLVGGWLKGQTRSSDV